MVLVACLDGDGVGVVFVERFAAATGRWRVALAEGAAGGAFGAVEGHVGEEDGGEVSGREGGWLRGEAGSGGEVHGCVVLGGVFGLAGSELEFAR